LTEDETRSESEDEEYLLYFCISWRQFQLISFHTYLKTFIIGSIYGINLGDNWRSWIFSLFWRQLIRRYRLLPVYFRDILCRILPRQLKGYKDGLGYENYSTSSMSHFFNYLSFQTIRVIIKTIKAKIQNASPSQLTAHLLFLRHSFQTFRGGR
jgi:hypothetical protein